jgi:hypothetical protein
MARGHGRSHPKDQLLAATREPHSPANGQNAATTGGNPVVAWKFFWKISSGQCVDSIQQVFLACDSSHLIAQLAVLEKE